MSQLTRSLRVERPLEDLAEILGARPSAWLEPFARIAVHAGETAGDRRAEQITRGRGSRDVTIDLTDAPVADEHDHVDFGIAWTTAGFRWVFSSFEGRIVAARDGSGCVLTIEGSYDEPAAISDPAGAEAVAAAANASAATLLEVVRTAAEEQARQDA